VFHLIAYLAHDAYKMAVHCEKFNEERAESVIKSSIQKLGCMHLKPEQLNVMQFLCVRDVFSILPTGFGKCFVLLAPFWYLTS